MTTLSLIGRSSPLRSDALVVAVAQGGKGATLVSGADAAPGMVAALTAAGATGKADEVTKLARLDGTGPRLVVAVGVGAKARRYPAEVVRRASGAAARVLAGTASATTTLAELPVADGDGLRAVAEGTLLGAYTFTRYRSQPTQPLGSLAILAENPKDKAAAAVLRRAEIVSQAVALVRDLVNTSPSDLHPAELADVAKQEASRVGLTVEVLEGKALVKGGFGGIVGVGQGSANGPRLVHLSHRGRGGDRPRIALVGKGITFDSGGLSLKPATAMEEMKMDMGGAAAVIATMAAVAKLGLRVDVDAWVPMAENMPSGSAIRPSDVLTMRGGKRVEVNNTDAEGRLILADAIARAAEDGPELIVDVATLTGAQLVALGARTAGVMGNDNGFREQVVAAADRAGEASWAMPLPADLRKGLDSEVADLQNTGPREGGMLTAGLFLQEFVPEGVRWAHLDIAGPAYNSGEAYGYTPHGGTGAAVRTFIELLTELAG